MRLHAGRVVEDDSQVAAANLDAAAVTFLYLAIGCRSFWIEAQGGQNLITGNDHFFDEVSREAFSKTFERGFETFFGNLSEEGSAENCDLFLEGVDFCLKLVEDPVIRRVALIFPVERFSGLRNLHEWFSGLASECFAKFVDWVAAGFFCGGTDQ